MCQTCPELDKAPIAQKRKREPVTPERLQAKAAERGGQCVNPSAYQNNETPLTWECAEGHQWRARWGDIQRGKWCPACSGRLGPTAAELQAKAAERGGQCLNPEAYARNTTKLTWQCAQGHQWLAAWACIRRGTWCKVCLGRAAPTVERIQALAAERGGRCLNPEEYRTTHANLKWECAEGHQWLAQWANVQFGSWCKVCAGQAAPTVERIQALAAERGGRCLNPEEYRSTHAKLRWECAEGHQWLAAWAKVQAGRWCPTCARNTAPTPTTIQAVAAEKGGLCLNPEEYKRNTSNLLWECAHGHQWVASWASIQSGRWCHTCRNKTEGLVRQYLTTVLGLSLPYGTPAFLKNSGGPRQRYSLDGYNAEANFAFEYHGKQHYEWLSTFHGPRDSGRFEAQVARDEHVRSLCAEKHLYLMEIPYITGITTPAKVVAHCQPYAEAYLGRVVDEGLVAIFLASAYRTERAGTLH